MDTSPTDDANKFSQPFRDMAERIERNLLGEFAGAILIVPPEGEPVEVMIADPSKDPEAFWAVAASKVEIAVQVFRNAKAGGGGGFQQYRR